jgi:hypothetical protein
LTLLRLARKRFFEMYSPPADNVTHLMWKYFYGLVSYCAFIILFLMVFAEVLVVNLHANIKWLLIWSIQRELLLCAVKLHVYILYYLHVFGRYTVWNVFGNGSKVKLLMARILFLFFAAQSSLVCFAHAITLIGSSYSQSDFISVTKKSYLYIQATTITIKAFYILSSFSAVHLWLSFTFQVQII